VNRPPVRTDRSVDLVAWSSLGALPDRSKPRVAIYVAVSIALVVAFFSARRFADVEFANFDALSTTAAAFALIVGVSTLVRYHTRPNNTQLFIGVAFVGTGVFDLYHAFLGSAYFVRWFPSAPAQLAAWSWTTSRLFLSVVLLASLAASRREERLGEAGRIEARGLYDQAVLLAVVCLAFFLFVPLPDAYWPDLFVSRPHSLGLAVVFLLTLVGFLRKGDWRREPFEHWLILALIVFVGTEALFDATSGAPYDLMSGVAHVLKIVAYSCVLAGTAVSSYALFWRVEEAGRELAETNLELEQAREVLSVYADRLRSSNAELEQFAYAASHDLKEPLRMVDGYVRLLATRYAGQLDEQADQYIAYTIDGVERMQQLIQDLLTYSRVETHGQPFETTEASRALTWAVANLEAAIRESSASVTHDALPVVVAEPTQLGQLLQNLVGNAIKYRGEAPPEVHVSADRVDDAWQFTVADNGMGIAPDDRERVFELFRRLDAGGEHPGSGIGLAVCKRIVERHGGRIWVDSVPGQGSKFRFTLPDSEAPG